MSAAQPQPLHTCTVPTERQPLPRPQRPALQSESSRCRQDLRALNALLRILHLIWAEGWGERSSCGILSLIVIHRVSEEATL